MNPWLSILLVLTASRGLLAGMNLCHRRFRPPSETTRKLMHAGMGLILCACPWLFQDRWPVVLLCGVFVGLLLARPYVPPLQRHVRHVIYGVPRASRGEFYFPLAVAALFLSTGGRPVIFFVIPILALALADPAAALVGTRYGLHRYRSPGGWTSVEGSVAFGVVAFLCVHVPLLVGGDLPRGDSLVIALNLALLLTLIEAVSWNGLDNLLVPLGGFALLRAYTAMGAASLHVATGVAVGTAVLAPVLWSAARAGRRAALAFAAAGAAGAGHTRRGFRLTCSRASSRRPGAGPSSAEPGPPPVRVGDGPDPRTAG